MPFEGFIKVGQRSRSCGLNMMSMGNLLVSFSLTNVIILTSFS